MCIAAELKLAEINSLFLIYLHNLHRRGHPMGFETLAASKSIVTFTFIL